MTDKYIFDEFNPQPQDYFEPYNESIKKNFNPKYLKFAELTYRIFSSGDGKEWLELKKKESEYTFVDLTLNNCELHLAAVEGVRKHLFNIEALIEAHKKHLESV